MTDYDGNGEDVGNNRDNYGASPQPKAAAFYGGAEEHSDSKSQVFFTVYISQASFAGLKLCFVS